MNSNSIDLYLKKAELSDKQEVASLYQSSEALHRHWSFPPDDYDDYLSDTGRYFLCCKASKKIVGTFCLSGIVRGYFQSAYLGYDVFSPFHNKGFLRAGIALLIDEAFGVLNLHRLEANIQPENLASIRLVKHAGFVREGFSRQYLNVGGQGWKDHERWALLNDHWSMRKVEFNNA